MSVEYSSPNDNLILKKKNPFLGEQLTQFPQYKSAVPNSDKLKSTKNDMPQILSYEGFDKNILKQSKILNTSKNEGFVLTKL